MLKPSSPSFPIIIPHQPDPKFGNHTGLAAFLIDNGGHDPVASANKQAKHTSSNGITTSTRCSCSPPKYAVQAVRISPFLPGSLAPTIRHCLSWRHAFVLSPALFVRLFAQMSAGSPEFPISAAEVVVSAFKIYLAKTFNISRITIRFLIFVLNFNYLYIWDFKEKV